MFGRQTETAIAAMSCLSPLWDRPTSRLSAAEIARARGLQIPIVAKVLSALAQAGLVQGTPGPGGGYRLARDPHGITFREVADVFERGQCDPFKAFQCVLTSGEVPPTVRRKVERLAGALDDLLSRTTFDAYLNGARGAEADLTARHAG